MVSGVGNTAGGACGFGAAYQFNVSNMSLRDWLLGRARGLFTPSARRLVPEQQPAADVSHYERQGPFRTRISRPRWTHGGRPIEQCPCAQCKRHVQELRMKAQV